MKGKKKGAEKKTLPSQCHCEAPHRISIEGNIVWALIKMCSENNMFKKSALIQTNDSPSSANKECVQAGTDKSITL